MNANHWACVKRVHFEGIPISSQGHNTPPLGLILAFPIFTESFHPKSKHSLHTEKKKQNPALKKAIFVWLILNYYNDQSTIAIAMCGFRHPRKSVDSRK